MQRQQRRDNPENHPSTCDLGMAGEPPLSYRSIDSAIRFHGQEICDISTSDPPSAVGIHSVQPLFVSRQWVTALEERKDLSFCLFCATSRQNLAGRQNTE